MGGLSRVDVTIRAATADDVAFLTDVVVEATYDQGRFPDDFDEVDFRAGFGAWTAEQVRGELDGSSTSVVEVDGVRAGRLRVVRRRDLVEIAGLQLLPERQSQGVGRTVVETIVQQARADRLPVELGVEKDNPRARAFWERCGFDYVGEDQDEHRLRLAPR
ncbi:GNAT family N-acetyltransferase [Nocardioides KLBMP 9356]|uniref:GNAT family N-acetyltransferase n=1 Tax=Nocardioides potassii TaxID=2911371 RepID=A0ABS9HBL3_9ACTN|nr:GNAT family N-acetyltransferase [Nocardioides potassii]MCF6378577.1 GNAT family N-acetyltransferase [Nocardioides potassii]